MIEFIEYPDRELLFLSLARTVQGQLGDQLRREEPASLCVPGGTTPGPLFDLLSAADLDWPNVAVVLNDERWVPESNPRSNTALLRQRLLTGRAAGATLVPLYAPTETPEESLPALTEGLRAHLPLTVAVLGMGEDMHTASLFPGGDLLGLALSSDAPPLLPMRASGAGEPRVTLTAPALNAAIHLHLLILGQSKRDALDRARTLPPEEAPVRAILDTATVHWAA
jgi:6-phosphogluconolactonase